MTTTAPVAYIKGGIDPSFCISEAWELVKRRPWLYIGAALLVIVLAGFIPYISMLLLGPMMGGFAYIVLNDIRNQPVSFGMIFKGFEKFLKLVVIGLVQAIPGIVLQLAQLAMEVNELFDFPTSRDTTFFQAEYGTGITVAFVIVMVGYYFFFIIWNWAMMFAIPLVIEFDAGIIEAITLSFGATFNNLGGIIILGILGGLVALLGMLVICIGLFVAIPVVYAANVIAYRQVFPSDYGDEFDSRGGVGDGSIFGLNN